MNNNHKIAVMTWYTYKNYGTALQSSALIYKVNKLGYKTDIILYQPKSGRNDDKKLTIKLLIEKLYNKIVLSRNNHYFGTSYIFDEYIRNKFTETNLCNSYPELHDLNNEYDVFICGSDQIWSPLCYDSKYFLDFVENPNKMVAYAPSIGSNEIVNPLIREQMKKLINRFKHLSVREQQGANIIRELTGQDAKVVLDPTLLLDPFEWDLYIKKDEVKKIQGEYIVCYFLGDADKYMGYVCNLSKEMGVSYYVIPVTMKQKKSSRCVPFEVGPCEFVSLISNAKYVVTDSFHGVAFSVNYNIPFSVFKRFNDNDPKNQNSRIFNLLSMLGLESRLVDYKNKNSVQATFDCNFSEVNSKLVEKRNDSMKYLENALRVAVNEPKVQDSVPFKITDLCCGCGACASVCAKGAVSIVRSDEGFDHYSVDITKCVSCGKCKSVCPMTNIKAPDIKNSLALYSFKSNSDETLKKSSSGGIGHELASQLLDNGYAVCGCMYDSTTNTSKHIWVTPDEKEKLPLLQGSKYLQSNTAEAISELDNISENYKVAFFGTPCQAAAVDKILSGKAIRSNSVIVDLICHGVPSYHLWNKYLVDVDKKCGTGANPNVLFRSKEQEWRKLLMWIAGNNKVYKKGEHKDDFYAFFRRGLCYLESCSDCPYRERSAADLRIGDYWGEKFINDKQGVSMVIANTAAGSKLVGSLNQICNVAEQNLDEYWSVQFPYNSHRPLIREQLITELKDENTDLHELRKKYCAYYDSVEKIGKITKFVKRVLKRG